MPQSNSWTGGSNKGARVSTPQQVQRVAEYLRDECVGIDNAVHSETISVALSMEGRTLRAAISDLDGKILKNRAGEEMAFIIESGDHGYFLCEYADEADDGSRRLRAAAAKMLGRADRRERAAQLLPRIQSTLWAEVPEELT